MRACALLEISYVAFFNFSRITYFSIIAHITYPMSPPTFSLVGLRKRARRLLLIVIDLNLRIQM